MRKYKLFIKKTFSRKTISEVLIVAFLALTLGPQISLADTLTSIGDTLSDTLANATSVTHTIDFTTTTNDNLKRITVRFSTTQGGSTKPAGLDVSSTTLGTLTGLGSGWSIDTSSASNGVVFLTRGSAVNVPNGTAISIPIQGITNSAIDDCGQANSTLTDVCQVRITTFSDDGVTSVDSGDTTYFIHENPNLTFEVKSVSTSQTHNGVTTNYASTPTTMDLSNLSTSHVGYITQEIVVTTNAPHGFKVNVYLANPLEGVMNSNNTFDPFGATNATWATPQLWDTPTGTSANSNSGWIAANTTDTGVTGWSSASQKFGPISATPRTVAISTTAARTGMSIFVTYAVGVNAAHPADLYSGKLVYDLQATY